MSAAIRIPLSSPDITEVDIEAVISVLRTPRLSLGPKLSEFEETMAQYVGVPYAVALSSGTAGLYLALETLGIGEGDDVLLPSFTFIAVVNAVLHRKATPVFVDIDPTTLNLDPSKIEQAITDRTRAIIVVHTFGCPVDLDPILAIAAKNDLRVIEDACEAIGAQYKGREIGGFGDLAVFSFYPNKPITTGEGGVVVTRDAELARTIRALRNQGRRDEDGWLEHSLFGYNYRISEMNCALGISQLNRIGSILARREAIAQRYAEELQKTSDLTSPCMNPGGARISWFAFVVQLSLRFRQEDRDWIIRDMAARGIECRQYFPALHLLPVCAKYATRGTALPATEHVSARTIALPFFNRLTDDQIRDVCRNLLESVNAAADREDFQRRWNGAVAR